MEEEFVLQCPDCNSFNYYTEINFIKRSWIYLGIIYPASYNEYLRFCRDCSFSWTDWQTEDSQQEAIKVWLRYKGYTEESINKMVEKHLI